MREPDSRAGQIASKPGKPSYKPSTHSSLITSTNAQGGGGLGSQTGANWPKAQRSMQGWGSLLRRSALERTICKLFTHLLLITSMNAPSHHLLSRKVHIPCYCNYFLSNGGSQMWDGHHARGFCELLQVCQIKLS